MNDGIAKADAKTLKDFAAKQGKKQLPGMAPNKKVLGALDALGRVRLSEHFFMRDFLYSEVAAAHGIANVPDEAELAIKAGRGLCKNLLEPLHAIFGHVTIRSAFRSANVNGFCNANAMGCASNQNNYARHIWDHEDADGWVGATACIVIPWFVDWLEGDKDRDWRALAWFIHDHLPYSEMVFYPKNAACNLTWRQDAAEPGRSRVEDPRHKIGSVAFPRGTLTAPGMTNYTGRHDEHYPDFPDLFHGRGRRAALPGSAEYGTGLHHLSDACRAKQREDGRFQELLSEKKAGGSNPAFAKWRGNWALEVKKAWTNAGLGEAPLAKKKEWFLRKANLQDRCRGLMVGLGVGNVLGVPQEGWPRHVVEASYPNGIRDIETEPGEPDDDDLAQAIILAESSIDAGSGELDVEDIGRRFWVWAEENGRGIGIQTADVLSRIGGDMPRCAGGAGVRAREPSGQPALEAARQVWEESGRYSAGNGAVMRCAPLAIRWKRDEVALARNTALSAVVTHADPRCIWSAAVVNLATAMLLRGEAVEVSGVLARTRQTAERLGDSLADFGITGAVPETVVEACSIPSGITPAGPGPRRERHGLHPEGDAGSTLVRDPGLRLRRSACGRRQRRRRHGYERGGGRCSARRPVRSQRDFGPLARAAR